MDLPEPLGIADSPQQDSKGKGKGTKGSTKEQETQPSSAVPGRGITDAPVAVQGGGRTQKSPCQVQFNNANLIMPSLPEGVSPSRSTSAYP